MCKKLKIKKNPSSVIDKCLRNLIERMQDECEEAEPIASCCGHGRYPMTIVAKNSFGDRYEVMTDLPLRNKRKFYKRDADGYYYIPEVLAHLNIQPYISGRVDL